jgi:2-methylcitrate dehydratase PrpD
MKAEKRIVEYVCDTSFDDLSGTAVATVRNMLRADIGTAIAGARADGCAEIVDYLRDQGGSAEATVLLHGGKLPAQSAALANAVMARALDYCDAIAPGAHIGSSTMPVALACAELRGGCDGREFLAALAIGTEVAARFNLTEAAYDGLDPTGICVPFGATAVACRLLGLDRRQTLNALGIALNRCGGSFQSNIDGTLCVRLNQGWVARDAINCARLARAGITGPHNFLEGIYGYLHLYGRDCISVEEIVGGLGKEDRLEQIVYKKYPSCGATQGPTEAIISLLREQVIEPNDIESVKLTLPPYAFRLVGHEFAVGDNPTVDGQFSAGYCIANVLLRGDSRIHDFDAEAVMDPAIVPWIEKVSVVADPELDRRGHTAMDMTIETTGGDTFEYGLDIAPGFPGNPLSDEDHVQRFMRCIEYAGDRTDAGHARAILGCIESLETSEDVRALTGLLSPGERDVSMAAD